jgi:hypothetical protein
MLGTEHQFPSHAAYSSHYKDAWQILTLQGYKVLYLKKKIQSNVKKYRIYMKVTYTEAKTS